jgi:hypothetical protein
MKAMFCEKTFDLHLLLDKEDNSALSEHGYSFLTAHDKGYHFWLKKFESGEETFISIYDGIGVHMPEPDMLQKEAWHVRITEETYQRLKKQREIGTRYNEQSKIKIFLE